MHKCWLSLLLIPFLAPACAPPEKNVEEDLPRRHVVLLADSLRAGNVPAKYLDSLAGAGNRVLFSGYPGESANDMVARLPWLLQPGVDLFIYDHNLAGKPGEDSLLNYLSRMEHPAEVVSFK